MNIRKRIKISEEKFTELTAPICLNCPFPKCKDTWTNSNSGCKYYEEKVVEVLEKYEREQKAKS